VKTEVAFDPVYARERLTERLSPVRKVRLAGEIFWSYVRVRVRLLRDDLPAILATLRKGPADAQEEPSLDEQLTAVRLARAVARALAPLPFDSRCLVRSLVLSDLLGRRRIAAHLVIGVRNGTTFEAHAWVEMCGIALLPGDAAEYDRLVEL
jgi:hypothetical protein